jgi:nitrate/nitrite transporter NarK
LSRGLLGAALPNLGYGYYFYLMVTWLPSYLVDARHLPLRTAGAYALVPYLMFAAGEPLGGWIADRLVAIGWDEIRSRKIVITVAYVSSLLLIPAGLVADTHTAVLLLGGASLVGLATGNMYALVQRVSEPGQVGFSTGVFNLAGNIPGVLAPIVTGLILERTGSYFPAFVVAVAVLLAVLPVYWVMVRTPALTADGVTGK